MSFGYSTIDTDASLQSMVSRYRRTGHALCVDFRSMIKLPAPSDRATHLLHPYPAKLLAHIPFFFLANSILSKRGDTVLDPFCGSGTVVLEALLAGRSAIGVDCNPFARLLAKVKTTKIEPRKLRRMSESLISRIPAKSACDPPDVVNLSHWFYPHVIRQLQRILEAVRGTHDRVLRDFFQVCFSKCLRSVSLANPRLSVPVRLQLGQYPEGHPLRDKSDRHLRRLKRVNVIDQFKGVLSDNIKRMESLASLSEALTSANITGTDSRWLARRSRKNAATAGIPDGSIQLVVTSPPYPGAEVHPRF